MARLLPGGGAVPSCPEVGLLAEAAGLSHFGVAPAQPDNLHYQASLRFVDGSCRFEQGHVQLDYAVDVLLRPGPRLTQNRVDLNYFVAVVSPDGSILQRQRFHAPLILNGGEARLGTREQLSQRLPIARPEEAAQYKIVIGFELTEAQLDYNRSRL